MSLSPVTPVDHFRYAAAESGQDVNLTNAAVGGAAQHGSRRRTGVSSILNDDGSIDNDGLPCATWVAMWRSVSCLVPEIRRIKDSDVGTIALLQLAAITQFERLRWAARHFVNRLFERDQSFVVDVVPNNFRKSAVKAR